MRTANVILKNKVVDFALIWTKVILMVAMAKEVVIKILIMIFYHLWSEMGHGERMWKFDRALRELMLSVNLIFRLPLPVQYQRF